MFRKSTLVACSLALLLVASSQLAAQDVMVGVKGGINIADLSIDDPAEPFPTDSRTTFVGGGFAEFGIGSVLAIQPEILYVQNGASSTLEADGADATLKFKLNYISVPVLLKARIPVQGTVRPSVYAGGVVSFETQCKVSAEVAGFSADADCDALSAITEDPSSDLDTKSVDFGLVFGAALAVPVGPVFIVGDARYNLGLTDINDTLEIQEVSIKNRAWQFMAGFGFPL